MAHAPGDAASVAAGRKPGVAVPYRWRPHPGKERTFVDAWSRISWLRREERGSLGSRLHRGADGLWYAYAPWPSSDARDRALAAGRFDAEPAWRMGDAIAESLREIALESVADFMLPPGR